VDIVLCFFLHYFSCTKR